MKRFVWSTLPVLSLSVSLALVASTATGQPPQSGPNGPESPQLHVAGLIPNVAIHPDYDIAPLVTGLDFPTAVTFSATRLWVSEAGALISGLLLVPKVKQVEPTGTVTTILSADQLQEGTLVGPLTDITFHQGLLWITHRQVGVNNWLVGAISKFDPADPVGTFTTVITNLPAAGDHFTEEIIFDSAGRAYFSQGTATNSSVVGADSWLLELWLQLFPTFHDFAPKDLVLSGASFKTAFPFPLDPDASKITAPFMPFGSGPIPPGTVIPAATPATPQEGIIAGSQAVYSFDPSAANPSATMRLEGWGLRNPFGIGIDPFRPNRLFVTNNGADVRSMVVNGQLQVIEARPIENDWDDMFVIHVGGKEEFFGWPDFFHNPQTGGVLPVTDPLFCEQKLPIPCPQFVLDRSFHRRLRVERASAQFEEHSSANKFDFSTSREFGFFREIFVAETGSFVPVTGAEAFVGYKVVRVNRRGGRVHDFIVNLGKRPEEIFEPTGFNKPIDVKFKDERMFVVDLGVFEPGLDLMQPGTGKVWVVFRLNFGS